MPTKLIELLKRFNRKERFHLLNQVVAGGVSLDKDMARELDKKLSLGSLLYDNSDRCFIAMDYHLDWLYAALFLATLKEIDSDEVPRQFFKRECLKALDGAPIVKGNQEDIDLLIGVEREGVVHLIMIEAKGDTAWSTKQMKSKIKKLKAIFGDVGDNFDHVKPHYVLLSPREPQKLKLTLPEWIRNKDAEHEFSWMKLAMFDEKGFWKIQRTKEGPPSKKCPEDGYPNWKIRGVKVPKKEI